MANFMTRRFTLREKILLVVLLVILLIGLYFFLVFYPVQRELARIDDQQDLVTNGDGSAEYPGFAYLEARKAEIERMQKEIEEILALPEEERTIIPECDNATALTAIFGPLFTDMKKNVSMQDLSRLKDQQPSGTILSRDVSISFSTNSFERVKTIVYTLAHTGFRYRMESVNIRPDTSNDEIRSGDIVVSITMKFYEIVP